MFKATNYLIIVDEMFCFFDYYYLLVYNFFLNNLFNQDLIINYISNPVNQLITKLFSINFLKLNLSLILSLFNFKLYFENSFIFYSVPLNFSFEKSDEINYSILLLNKLSVLCFEPISNKFVILSNYLITMSVVLYILKLFYCLIVLYVITFIYFNYINDIDFRFLTYNNFIWTKISYIIEKNLGVLDDIQWYVFVLMLLIWNSILFSHTIMFLSPSEVIVFFITFLLFIFITTMPIYFILLHFGFLFFIFLRGSLKYNSFFFESVYDLIAFFAYVTRYYLQFVRWALITISYLLLHEFFFDSMATNWGTTSFNDAFEAHSISLYIHFFFSNLFQLAFTIIRWIFEFCDLVLLFFLQTLAFTGIIFWLFNFLFTSSFINKKENYLNKK